MATAAAAAAVAGRFPGLRRASKRGYYVSLIGEGEVEADSRKAERTAFAWNWYVIALLNGHDPERLSVNYSRAQNRPTSRKGLRTGPIFRHRFDASCACEARELVVSPSNKIQNLRHQKWRNLTNFRPIVLIGDCIASRSKQSKGWFIYNIIVNTIDFFSTLGRCLTRGNDRYVPTTKLNTFMIEISLYASPSWPVSRFVSALITIRQTQPPARRPILN